MKIKNILVLVAFWCLSHLSYTLYDGLNDRGNRADVAVIFGNKVNEDGTLSSRLEARMAQGLALYQQGRVKMLLVSGGLGKEGHWEAEKMRDYLLAHGVPSERILVDNDGNDTELTVANSLKIMQEQGLQSAISVSQYFHQTRIKMLYRKNGFTEIESSSPLFFALGDGYSLAREFVGFYVEWLK